MAPHGKEQIVPVGYGRHEACAQAPAREQGIFGHTLALDDPEDITIVGQLVELHVGVALARVSELRVAGIKPEHVDPVGRRPFELGPPGNGLVDAESGARMRVGGVIGPLGPEGNESSHDRVLDHDGILIGRLGIGIGLVAIAGNGNGSFGTDLGEIFEKDHVGTVLEVGAFHAGDPDVAEGARGVLIHLERQSQLVDPGLSLGGTGWRPEIRGA